MASTAMAQDTAKVEKPWKLKWSGFVNPHFFADSRQVVGGREDMMLFYPKPADLDANGEDINANPSINLLSITARVALGISGPDFLGAKTRGYIEGDFTGSTNESNNDLRLRHAYINMDWGKREVLAGQYWYAMTIHEIMPGTCPLNMGSPFHPYARYNQVRYTEHFGHMEAIAAAQFQIDNKSQGPNGASTKYQRNSCIPEMNLQLRYRDDHRLFGVAANVLTIQPRDFITDVTNTYRYKTDKTYSSLAFSVFGRWDTKNWSLKAQTLINDNLYEGSTMGGYIERWHDALTERTYSYEDWHYTTVWCDFGKRTGAWRPGIFAGYAKNMSFGKKMPDQTVPTDDHYTIYGRGFEIENLWRIQPRIEYFAGKALSFAAEVEYTHAQYGKKTTNSEQSTEYYEHDNDGGVANIRYMLSAVYRF